jgi:hypothetical protein
VGIEGAHCGLVGGGGEHRDRGPEIAFAQRIPRRRKSDLEGSVTGASEALRRRASPRGAPRLLDSRPSRARLSKGGSSPCSTILATARIVCAWLRCRWRAFDKLRALRRSRRSAGTEEQARPCRTEEQLQGKQERGGICPSLFGECQKMWAAPQRKIPCGGEVATARSARHHLCMRTSKSRG